MLAEYIKHGLFPSPEFQKGKRKKRGLLYICIITIYRTNTILFFIIFLWSFRPHTNNRTKWPQQKKRGQRQRRRAQTRVPGYRVKLQTKTARKVKAAVGAVTVGGGDNGMAIPTVIVRKIEAIEHRMTTITAPPRLALPLPTTRPRPGRDPAAVRGGDEERGAATFGL